MKIECLYPYNEYNGYLVVNKEPRRNVCLVHKETKQRTTISYARYLMSVSESRILLPEEQVDHIDGDKLNDVIENLQILTIRENNIKRHIQNNSTRKMVEMICPNCKEVFHKLLNQSFLQKKTQTFNTCSKSCLYEILKCKYSKEELIQLGKNQIVRHYRK